MIAIVYGSSLGNTQDAAEAIAAALNTHEVASTLINVATIKRDLTPLLAYDTLLLGCSTWNIGELQDDWYDAFPLFQKLDLAGKRVALFGCGDQFGYPDTFQDALGILAKAALASGAALVGRWPTDGYDLYESLGVEDGTFFGLAIDDDNQANLTAGRVERWVGQLVGELQGEASQVAVQ